MTYSKKEYFIGERRVELFISTNTIHYDEGILREIDKKKLLKKEQILKLQYSQN